MSSAWDTGEWWDGGHPRADDDERHRVNAVWSTGSEPS
jgi:hypothetical protein